MSEQDSNSLPGRLPEEVADRLQMAFQVHRSGDLAAALGIYREVLAEHGEIPEALNFGALAAFHSGNRTEAQEWIERAIALRPDYVEALNNLGNMRRAAQDHRGAVEAYRKALAIHPDYVNAWFNLGNALRDCGEPESAVEAFEQAVARQPQHVASLNNLGALLQSLGRSGEAVDLLRRAIRINSEFADARANLGNALKDLGDLRGARDAYQGAVSVDPGHVDAINNLGNAYAELGDPEEAIIAYRRALAVNEDHVAAQLNLGAALLEAGELEEAMTVLRKAAAGSPQDPQPRIQLGHLAERDGRLDDAIAEYREALDINPGDAGCCKSLALACLSAGHHKTALKTCDAGLLARPAEMGLLAAKAHVLREMERIEEADELLDFDRFVRVLAFDAPAEYPNLDAFNRDLVHHILQHPTLAHAPQSHATRDAQHSGELLVEPLGPMRHFRRMIASAFRRYRDELVEQPPHPFVEVAPDRVKLTAWSVVMKEGGHQIQHIHPQGWLSGVYYAQVPACVSVRDDQHDGWLEFGRPPEEFPAQASHPMSVVAPMEGVMVVFPSFVYHRTIPFRGTGTRVCIAFDVMPA